VVVDESVSDNFTEKACEKGEAPIPFIHCRTTYLLTIGVRNEKETLDFRNAGIVVQRARASLSNGC